MRLWRWFNEPVLMARGWYVLALAFAIRGAIELAILVAGWIR